VWWARPWPRGAAITWEQYTNRVEADFGTVSGGFGKLDRRFVATIGGGYGNTIGQTPSIAGRPQTSFITALSPDNRRRRRNKIQDSAQHATIGEAKEIWFRPPSFTAYLARGHHRRRPKTNTIAVATFEDDRLSAEVVATRFRTREPTIAAAKKQDSGTTLPRDHRGGFRNTIQSTAHFAPSPAVWITAPPFTRSPPAVAAKANHTGACLGGFN